MAEALTIESATFTLESSQLLAVSSLRSIAETRRREVAHDLLSLQQIASVRAYKGTPCLRQDDTPDKVTLEEAQQILSPTDEQIDTVMQMAAGTFNKAKKSNALIVLGETCDKAGQNRQLVSAVNVRWGGGVCEHDNGNNESYAAEILQFHSLESRRGYGLPVLSTAIKAVHQRFHREGATIRLDVGRHNSSAQRFYRRIGLLSTGHWSYVKLGKAESGVMVAHHEWAGMLGTVHSNLQAVMNSKGLTPGP